MPALDAAEVRFFRDLQTLIVRRRRSRALPAQIRRICAVDAAYAGPSAANVVAAASVFVEGELSETSTYRGVSSLPYHPGLFYLHEGPFAMQAVLGLSHTPDLVCFDAHGSAHPTQSGMAATVGAVLDIPSVGVCKSLLAGRVEAYQDCLDAITIDGQLQGYVSSSSYLPDRAKAKRRYWSAGFSVGMGELEGLIRKYGHICLSALAESDRLSRMEIKKWRN
jgi:deoxyinosine 3'endonuclease (endonuclease V)